MPNDGPPMVENMLSSVNPFHIPDEVPTAQCSVSIAGQRLWGARAGAVGGRCTRCGALRRCCLLREPPLGR